MLLLLVLRTTRPWAQAVLPLKLDLLGLARISDWYCVASNGGAGSSLGYKHMPLGTHDSQLRIEQPWEGLIGISPGSI